MWPEDVITSSFHPDSLPEVNACRACWGKRLCAWFLTYSCKISWGSLDYQCNLEWIQLTRPVMDLRMPGLTPSASRALGQVTSGSGVPMGSWARHSLEGYKKILRKLTSFSLMHLRSNPVAVKHLIHRDRGLAGQSSNVVLVKTARRGTWPLAMLFLSLESTCGLQECSTKERNSPALPALPRQTDKALCNAGWPQFIFKMWPGMELTE